MAIVGSGPSGFFAAAAVLKTADGSEAVDDVYADMLEMLPTPWGLVHSGVAPDHPKIKTISAQSDRPLNIPGEDLPGTSRRPTSSAGATPIPISRR